MTEALAGHLKVALSSRYAIEGQLGQGGMATALFTGAYLANTRHATYDVHPCGLDRVRPR